MIRYLSISFLLSLSLSSTLCSQAWFQIDNFPGIERDDGTSFVIGSTAYCGSGVVPFQVLGDFYSFSEINGSWDTIVPLPANKERQYACGFSNDQYGFVFGGYDGNFLNDLWKYDPVQDQWLEVSALPSAGRGGSASFVIDSLAYIIGGKTDSADAIDEVWAYNMNADSWTQKNDLPFGSRWRASASASANNGYLAFGLDDSVAYHNELYEYDPNLDQWNQLTDFPEGKRNYVNMHTMGDQLISIGGYDSSGQFYNESWTYNVTTNNWNEIDSLPGVGRRGGMSFQLANAIYYTTGLTYNGLRFRESWKLEDPTYLNEDRITNSVQVYPNPIKDQLTIQLGSDLERKNAYFKLVDLHGKEVLTGSFQTNKHLLNIENLPPMVYILKVNWGNETIVGKLIKQ